MNAQIARYAIFGEMGRGFIGTYFRARDHRLDREVTLKVLTAEEARDPEKKARFQREAAALARLRNSSIATVLDFGEEQGAPYMAIEPLKGRRLSEIGRDQLGLTQLLSIAVGILDGLDHAHQNGVVNRNVNPATVLVRQEDGAPKLFDFSVARLTGGSMTGTGNIVGTPDYMSPEQVRGSNVDGRSDVFSVGCTLYEMLTGRPPFHSHNVMAIFYKVTHEEPDYSLVSVSAGIERVLPILKRSMEKKLTDRYQTAFEMAEEIRSVQWELTRRKN